MNDISLHILDIAENSINAGAKNIEININENSTDNILKIEIIDDGKGMSEEMVRQVTDPFVTSRTTRRVGLGIPLLKLAAETANGNLEIKSEVGKGTVLVAKFQLDHIDKQPLGNMVETLVTILANEHDFNLKYRHVKNEKKFEFDSSEFKNEIEKLNVDISHYLIILNNYLKKYYNNFN